MSTKHEREYKFEKFYTFRNKNFGLPLLTVEIFNFYTYPGRIFRLHRQVLFRLASFVWKSLSNPTRETSSLCLVGFASPYSRDAQFLAIAYTTQAH